MTRAQLTLFNRKLATHPSAAVLRDRVVWLLKVLWGMPHQGELSAAGRRFVAAFESTWR